MQSRVVPFENVQITSSPTVTLLWINKKNCEEHISKICSIVIK